MTNDTPNNKPPGSSASDEKPKDELQVSAEDSNLPLKGHYRPPAQPNKYVASHAPQTAPRAQDPNDRVNDLIDQIMRQEDAKKRAQNVQTPAKISRGDMIKLCVALSFLGFVALQIAFEFVKSQERDHHLHAKKLHTRDRKAFEEVSREQIEEEAKRLAKIWQSAQSRKKRSPKDLWKLLYQESVSPPANRYQRLLRCATSAPWSAYRSANYYKAADNLLVLNQGRTLFIFSPHFAGKETVFKGVFWQKKLGRITKKLGYDMSPHYPIRNIYLPVQLNSRGAILSGHQYLSLVRGDYKVTSLGPFALGPAAGSLTDKFISPISHEGRLWLETQKPVLESAAVAHLMSEVKRQVSRFLRSKRQRASLLSQQNHLNTAAGQKETLQHCAAAAKAYKMKNVARVADQELKRMRTKPYQRSHMRISSLEASKGVSLVMIGTSILANQRAIVPCDTRKQRRGSSLPSHYQFTIGKNGSISQIAPQKGRDHSVVAGQISDCVAKRLAGLKFPNPIDGKPAHVKLSLSHL